MDITILIPTHNRHLYLYRILTYYKDVDATIIVADSTNTTFEFLNDFDNVNYFHVPHLKLPQKLAFALKKVVTKFVVMCADDDFILPSGILESINFLEKNSGYIAAQGNCIGYNELEKKGKKINFFSMYADCINLEIIDLDFKIRLQKLFSKYRTIFSAVQYSAILQSAFNENIAVNNLYLNEYLTAIIPISQGKYKELNNFYQVREFSESSDDKTTDNLDVIINDANYASEYNEYVHYLVSIIHQLKKGEMEKDSLHNFINNLLFNFSENLKDNKTAHSLPKSKKKQLGNFIKKNLFFGETLINFNRKIERKKLLRYIIKTENDRKNVEKINHLILNIPT